MSKKNGIPMRVDPRLKKLFSEVKIERIKAGKNKKMLSDRRLSLAITRVPHLKEYLKEWEIKDE